MKPIISEPEESRWSDNFHAVGELLLSAPFECPTHHHHIHNPIVRTRMVFGTAVGCRKQRTFSIEGEQRLQ
jgi:hypothetical protein